MLAFLLAALLTVTSAFSQESASTMRVNALPVASARSVAAVAALPSLLVFTVPSVDTSYEVTSNLLVTSSTLHTIAVTVAYTDESNAARTLTLPFFVLAGTTIISVTNVLGAVPFTGMPLRIRCKAGTTITVATSGTFTTVVYNVEVALR